MHKKDFFCCKRFKALSLMGELFHFSCEIFYKSPRPSLKRRILFSDLEELLPTYYQVIFSNLPRTVT